jgi:nucleoside-diphosphate-sugar epimerase
MMLPETIRTEEELTEVMTRPRPVLVEFMRTLTSPLVILGAGGKMGPTLAILARRAAQKAGCSLEIIAVSRFSDQQSRLFLESHGVKTLSANLMERDTFASLPDTDNLVYLVGLKFGTATNPAQTWATNALIPAYTAERYPRARIAALSTGNVYPLILIAGGGSQENDPLTPAGEYSNACVARERILEFYSAKNQTPMTLLRLSFALDLRYGVLVDIAFKVFRGEAVDVSMSHMNCIWQGDANEMIIRSLGLAATPPLALNLVGSQHYSIRATAQHFGELMGKPVNFTGVEAETAFLSNNQRLQALLGEPPTPVETVMRWTAGWVMANGRLLNKPTHFEVRDGGY